MSFQDLCKLFQLTPLSDQSCFGVAKAYRLSQCHTEAFDRGEAALLGNLLRIELMLSIS
jgi:hypothetical protein